MPRPSGAHKWYFACECGASFFHRFQTAACPRCGEQIESPEKIEEPWNRLRKGGESCSERNKFRSD